eukprot:7386900-Prymnesium_polylepis.2
MASDGRPPCPTLRGVWCPFTPLTERNDAGEDFLTRLETTVVVEGSTLVASSRRRTFGCSSKCGRSDRVPSASDTSERSECLGNRLQLCAELGFQ